MIEATMPSEHWQHFRPDRANPFPADVVAQADRELDNLAALLEGRGIQVFRPQQVNWHKVGGYTAAMPRDGLITVGNHLIEAPFAWRCRRNEIDLAYGRVLADLEKDASVRVFRAPKRSEKDTLCDSSDVVGHPWVINDTRPAFDAADFMRFGKVLIGQFSHVTNAKGVEYLRQCLPTGYVVEMLTVNDPNAMHIDATLLPLREGLLAYNPKKTSQDALRRISVLRDWDLRPFPLEPKVPDYPPLFMTSPWLALNLLVLDGKHVLVERQDEECARWIESLGMTVILCPFRHVNSIGGSFHCATVDLVREPGMVPNEAGDDGPKENGAGC